MVMEENYEMKGKIMC